MEEVMMEIKGTFGQVFLGKCKGVGLAPRGENDPHVCITILTEDDDLWSPGSENFSSYWLEELIWQLEVAKIWMEKHCDRDGEYGWKFRKEK